MRSARLANRLIAGVQLRAKFEASTDPSSLPSSRPKRITISISLVAARLNAGVSPVSSKNRNRCGNEKYSWIRRYPWNDRGVTGSSAWSSSKPAGRTDAAGSSSCQRDAPAAGSTRTPMAAVAHRSWIRLASSSGPATKNVSRSIGVRAKSSPSGVSSRMRTPPLIRWAIGSVFSGRSGAKEKYLAAVTDTGQSLTSCAVRNSHGVASFACSRLCIGLPRGILGPARRFGSFGSGLNCATSIEGVGAR